MCPLRGQLESRLAVQVLDGRSLAMKSSKKAGSIILRCGGSEERLVLSHRDICLLDGDYFLKRPVNYRAELGLAFVKGLSAPPEGVVLLTHRRFILSGVLKALHQALEDQRELLAYSYQFKFSGQPEANGGGALAGFLVRGLVGSISVRPAGYCTLVLMEVAPTGRGRIAEIIDMRVRKSLETDNWGTLTLKRRSEPVGWFDELPRVRAWLDSQETDVVELLHGPAS